MRYVEHAANSGSTVRDLEVQRGSNPPGAVEKEDQVGDGHISRKKRRFPDGQFTIEKAVPGIPKTVEELVLLWRQGHPEKNVSPLYKFVCVSGRKQIIRGYTTKTWNLRGQNRAFNRLKSPFQIAARDSELSITEVGSDFEWKEALRVFHSKWSKDGNVPPLSSVLKNVK